MKLAEQTFEDNGKLIIKTTHNWSPVMERAKALKSAGADGQGSDSRLVGLIPVAMWTEWAKKWGVNPGNNEAMKEVVARELQDRDNAHLRVWEGNF